MICVDWGTSSFRAYRLAGDGAILGRRSAARGIMTVVDGDFAGTLRAEIGHWLAEGETRVLLCGMIGSRQGWVEAPYLPCPAGPGEIAAALVSVPFDGALIRLVPGLTDTDDSGTPEVMRGEETQIAGVLSEIGDGIACLPGSHSKWARITSGRISAYRTYLSGEAFAALRGGTILGRMMKDGPTDEAAFDRGLARAADRGHLLHHLFGVRTLGLFGQLAETESASYLSGLLIGHEVRAARPEGQTVHLIGATQLCALYARAIAACGGNAVLQDEDAAARGLAAIGRRATWN
ncbi:MAG TPA: 2-dehydro-3-deoxygalactonokinase [Acetobacteraceae bacterium]|jgi:2-dehydro-3-deoxygalactonokinase